MKSIARESFIIAVTRDSSAHYVATLRAVGRKRGVASSRGRLLPEVVGDLLDSAQITPSLDAARAWIRLDGSRPVNCLLAIEHLGATTVMHS